MIEQFLMTVQSPMSGDANSLLRWTLIDLGVVNGTITPSADILWVSGASAVAAAGIAAVALLGITLVVRDRLEWDSDGGEQPSLEEPLSDRERIRRLVSENGGQIRQSEIVDQVEWSKAKVSRLLADLEQDGDVTKLRLGRENLVCLQGEEPPASRSGNGN